MLNGIDVSNWQDINKVDKKLEGCSFCFIKVTEGNMFIDKKAGRFVRLCEKHGVAVFFYHFCHFKDGKHEDETKHFLAVVRDLLESTGYEQPVGLCLDVEADALSQGAAVNDSLRMITELTGANPIVYMSQSQVPVIGKYVDTERYGLWVANWNATPYPTEKYLRVDPWTTLAFWQYWAKDIDLDVFYGDRYQLEKYQDYVLHLESKEEVCGCNCACCTNTKCVGGI